MGYTKTEGILGPRSLGKGLIVRRATLLMQYQCQPPGGRTFLEIESAVAII